MNQVEALKKLISAKTIKIRNLEIENKALKKQLGKVAQELLNTRRRAEIEHARVRKAEKGLKKIKKILNKKAGSSQALSQVQEEVSAVLRSLNENFFEGVFFYTGRMAEFGENTGVGVSLTEIIKEIATPDKPYQYYVALVNAIVARFGQMMVQNMWRNRYQKQAAGYNTP